VNVPHISGKQILDFAFALPSLAEQRRIAGVLAAYDDLIENNQRRIQILEQMARALYREWFVEFRFPGHEKVRLVKSRLGSIPENWAVTSVGEIADVFRGRSYRGEDLADDGGRPFLNLKCIDRGGGFRRSGLKRYTGPFSDSHVGRKGDIVVAVTDMTQERRIVAHAALVPTLDQDFGVFSMDLVRVEPRGPIPKPYLYALLRFSNFSDEVRQHANGANVLHLSPDRIKDYSLALPPAELTARFVEIVGPSLSLSDTLANRADNLRRTRDLLLPRLLSGQIALDSTAA
jgi:type I restriction enzyme, S subunit